MLKIIMCIIGIILLLPIAITVVAAVCVTLVGGYVLVVLHFCGWLIAIIIAVILIVKLVKHFFP